MTNKLRRNGNCEYETEFQAYKPNQPTIRYGTTVKKFRNGICLMQQQQQHRKENRQII